MNRIIIYAPGVHTGGGLVLLRALLSVTTSSKLIFILDDRIRSKISLPYGAEVRWCKTSFLSRLLAELQMRNQSSSEDVLLCFHGLPPLMPNKAHVTVFVQNRLNLGGTLSSKGSWRTDLKRLLFRSFSKNAHEFIVQTPSMCLALKRCLGSATSVSVQPFLDVEDIEVGKGAVLQEKTFDFIYVADGATHKNHHALIAAWDLLALEEIRPSLVLTLGQRDQALFNNLEHIIKAKRLNIENVGAVSRETVFSLYLSTRALIFPSKSESFGIPLIEAEKFGLPILAPELDYVRDVCVPAETFDPDSPTSIARAVKRFLEVPEKFNPPLNANEFIEKLLDR